MLVRTRVAFLSTLILASMPGFGASDSDLEQVAKSVIPFLVRVQATFANCQSKGVESGWGLVVGEDSSQLYLAAPRHLFFSRTELKCGASSVALSLWQSSQRKWDMNFQSSSVPVPADLRDVDISFLRLPRPQGWQTSPPKMAEIASIARGIQITFLGYKSRASVPFTAGRILETCDPIGGTNLCSLVVDGLSTAPGDSGAPLLTTAGVAGLVLSEGQTLTGLRVDAMKQIAARAGVPWTLFTAEEVNNLGDALNKAILARDGALAGQLLDRRFNPDGPFNAGADRYPETPVSLATRSGLTNIASRLISSGVQDTRMAAAVAASDGNTAVIADLISNQRTLGCALAVSMQNMREDLANQIVTKASASQFGLEEPCMDRTPLHWATFRGYDTVANKLLDLGASPNKGHVDRIFFKGYPLTNAILRQNWPLVNRLIGGGASANVVEFPDEPRDFGGVPSMTIFGPLHAAALVGNIELIDRLVARGADPDVHSTVSQGSTVDGGSPFEAALISGKIAAARHLRDRYGVSPLGYRYKDRLIREIRENRRLDASTRLQVEAYVGAEAKVYCQSLRKESFARLGDYYNQEAKCRP